MKKILSLISLLMLFFLGVQAQTTKTWDFTQAMSEADVANLTADANWSYTESSKRYENKAEVSGELKVNGKVLEWTKGISFGTFAKGKLRLDNQKRLCLNGKGLSFTITTKKGAKLTIESQTASGGNTTRFLSATNLTVTNGFAAGNEKETNEGTVNEDGEVTITTNEGGINLYSIVLVEPEEETPTGDDVVSYTITMKDSGTSSDSGTRVTDIANTIADGSQYVSGIVNDNVFPAREGRGVKLGTSKKIGSITLTLAKKVKPLQIVVKARKYNDKGENYIKINDKEFELSEGDGEDCVVKYDGETSVSEIVITTTDKKFRTYVLGVTVTYVDKAELISETFDFNSVADAAVSNSSNAGDIVKAHKIVDKEGKNPSNATLDITPNTNVGDYPAEAVNVSRFVLTEAGPQLRLSGGYNGMTMKITKGDAALSEIKFYQTNWSRNTKADKGTFDPQTGTWQSEAGASYDDVTFTIQADTTEVWADGKLQEIVLHDMGQLWINSIDINPLHGVEIAPASGAELSAAIAAERAKVKNAEFIKVTLAAGGQYTVKEKIAFDATVIIEGNGAGIDASELDEPLIALTVGTTTPKNQDKYTDAAVKDFNLLDEITINNVMIKNLKKAIVTTNGQAWAVENLNITNSIIQLDNDSHYFIDFYDAKDNKAAIKNLKIQNNTIYNLKENNTGYFIRFRNASNAQGAFGTKNGTSTYDFNISDNTIIRTMTAKDFANNMVNNAKVTMTLKNNIFYDVYRLYQFVQNNQMSTTTDNYIFYDVTSPQANDQSRKDKQGNPYTTKLDSAPFDVPTEALDLSKANGGLNLTPKGDASKVGDPRWLGGKSAGEVTGIENVKNATVEDGAWYTISGQRVAQPTKGLYIHNGKKVIIK